MSNHTALETDLFGNSIQPGQEGELARRFLFPPFSVLSAREGDWQARKRQWLNLGIQSELGRPKSLMGEGNKSNLYGGTCSYVGNRGGRAHEESAAAGEASNTSVFDPVLAELAYSWFCPEGGTILDPFAGGSVRGIVAGKMGRVYMGIDLRPEQVAANYQQKEQLCPSAVVNWAAGDSSEVIPRMKTDRVDMIFSCPPYGPLEQYSDDPRDLSNMTRGEFMKSYIDIVRAASNKLRDDSFAVFVVGDYRDKKTGILQSLVGDTIAAFECSGMGFYNEFIYVTPCGTLPVRSGKQFAVGRKNGRTHQQMLVFLKGDGKRATARCPVFE